MREIPYKSVGDRTLALHVVPPRVSLDRPVPTAVFYHGGGWLSGTWRQFLPQAERLATLGMAAVLVEYRLDGPVGATADAVDAMNAIVESAGDIGADPTRIVAVGGSAGGHLALATAVLDLPAARPRHRPAALVLLNPVTDTTAEFPAGFGRDCFDSDEQSRRYSPRHHVTADFPPALIMHGTADAVVHHQNSIELVDEVWRRGGGPAEIVLYPGQRHGFFNPVASGVRHPAGASDAHFELTTAETTRFLQRTVLHAQRD
ncbi:MAG TPA: alpha/beta hydrolase fold domain-containing protein [Jiangellaceae bacterium]